MFYRKASNFETLFIKKLWNEIFGDSDEYINSFITHFGIENGYVCEKEKEIVAIAFAIPTLLNSPSNFEGVTVENRRGSLHYLQPVKYIYACATHPDYRRQGVMTNLLATVYQDACNEDYEGIFLHAADESLANYYRKLGFEDYFYRNHSFYYNHKEHKGCTKDTNSLRFLRKPLRPLRLKIIPPEQYQKKRAQILNNSCFVNWNEVFFLFLHQTGMQFCEFQHSIFSFRTECNSIIVDELLGDISHENAATLLFEHLPEFEALQIRSKGDDFCCGLIKWGKQKRKHPEKGWFAFAME
jgi:predicted acetyltransferase